MTGFIRTFQALGFGLLALAAQPVLAQQVTASDYGTARGWAVQAVSVEGQYMRCAGVAPGKDFTLEHSAEGWLLGIDVAAGAGSEVAGRVRIDGAAFDGTFYQLDSGRYGLFLSDAQAQAVSNGSTLEIEMSGARSQHSLAGSTAAMLKIMECDQNAGAAPTGSTAAATEPAAPVAPGTMESDAARLGAYCPDTKEVHSQPSDTAAKVTFINASDRALTLYWLDFDGNVVEYAGLLPGEEITQQSFVGHWWILKDFDGTCHGGAWGVYNPTERYEVF